MQRIFLPLNLDTDYQNVWQYAIALAQKSGAKLDILYATGSWLGKSSTHKWDNHLFPETDFLEALPEKQRQVVLKIWKDTAQVYPNFCLIYTENTAIKAITNQLETESYDLMVLGTRDKSHSSLIRGPFVNKVLAQTHVPTFIVPETLAYKALEHITYAADLQDFDEKILNSIIALARQFEARLTLLNISPPRKEGEQPSEVYLHVLNKTIDLTLLYPQIHYQFVEKNDIYDGIEEFVEMSNTQLVAMVNRTPIKNMNRGGMTQKVMKQINVPLLAYRKILVAN